MKNLFFRIISNQVKEARKEGIKIGKRKATEQYNKDLDILKSDLSKKYNRDLKIRDDANNQIALNKNKEIRKLKNIISKNRDFYNELRTKEGLLNILSNDIEDNLDSISIKIQEAIQPFFRTKAKIESTLRSSDKKDKKVESIFDVNIAK